MSDTKMGLTAPVKDGKMEYKVSSEDTGTKTQRGSSELGKDAFLQLLVCQMQNQDPLDPSTDTEYVAQLAQFSQLEQLQNLSSETEKAQAFALVGRYVTFKVEDTSGKTTFPEGFVDYVSSNGKNVELSVNGKTYSYNDIYQVVDEEYLAQKLSEAKEEDNE